LRVFVGEGTAPVRVHQLREILRQRHATWVWLGANDGRSALVAGDLVRIAAPRRTRSLGPCLVERGSEVALAVGDTETGARIADVIALYRHGAELSLEGPVGRALVEGARAAALLDAVMRWRGKAWWWRAQLAATLRAPSAVPAPSTDEAQGADVESGALSERQDALYDTEATAIGPLVAPGTRVLDIGCGRGREALALAALGAEVVGIDPDVAAIAHARAAVPMGASVSFRVGALPDLDRDLAGFDLVYLASDVLQVIVGDAARVKGLEACVRALVPGGRVVVPVRIWPPSRALRWGVDGPRRALRRLGLATGAAPGERVHRWGPEDPPFLRRVFGRREEVEALLCSAGLEIERWVGDFLIARKPPAPSRRYAPHPDVEAGVHDGALLLAHLATGATFRMNATGRRVWEALSRGRDRDAIVEEIVALPGASRARVERDVDALLAELAARGLVVEGTGP
jgi:SAM-dependent methyltransferase